MSDPSPATETRQRSPGAWLQTFVRTTTFRLAALQAVLLSFFTVCLLAFLYYSTAHEPKLLTQRELSEEMGKLRDFHAEGGLEQLNFELIQRAIARGRFYYYLADASGLKVTGDFDTSPAPEPAPGTVAHFSFSYRLVGPEGPSNRRGEGLVTRFDDKSLLVVGIDVDERVRVIDRVTGSIWIAGGLGIILTLAGAYFFSLQTARRVDQFSRTADAVVNGKLSERIPLSGTGDEFDRLGLRMNRMLERIERLVQAQRYAGDALAHDLRSPLSRLRNRLVELEADAENSNVQEAVEAARSEADSLLKVFQAILRLAKLEAGAGGTFVLTDISDLATSVAELFEPSCETAEQIFIVEVQPNLNAKADRELLAQALSNLVDNAIKYTPTGGTITLGAQRLRSGEVELWVSDSGPGIPSTQRQRARERFVRLEGSRSMPGHGLGLALVSAVADLHGGRFDLSDAKPAAESPGLRAAIILPPGETLSRTSAKS
jgi:signal transduction histidine kinase